MKTVITSQIKKVSSIVVLFSMLCTQLIPASFAEGAREFSPADSNQMQPVVAVKNTYTQELLPAESLPSGVWIPEGQLFRIIPEDPKLEKISKNQ